ncbi:hypothetical protein [Cellulomonas alba]|uniref:DUF3558 domain-containing protein n=1 Tax=Cellulomonas alba TaxID=3053467 RepID=A0ABT7SM35_9CELL|nr:hypothetical protein [Cellulomonas alba]MDM7856574.1 hypothetical protein [Cellulomonas alba]
MRTDRRTMVATAVGSLVVGGVTGAVVTGLGVGARADEPPLPRLVTQTSTFDPTTIGDDALPQQIENRGYACPAFTFLAPDGDHTASARSWSVTLSRSGTKVVGFNVSCVKSADAGGLEAVVDAMRRATSGPQLVREPVVEVSAFGAATRTDQRMAPTTTLTQWWVERDGWIVTAGVLSPDAVAADSVAAAEAMLSTWHWGPPGS